MVAKAECATSSACDRGNVAPALTVTVALIPASIAITSVEAATLIAWFCNARLYASVRYAAAVLSPVCAAVRFFVRLTYAKLSTIPSCAVVSPLVSSTYADVSLSANWATPRLPTREISTSIEGRVSCIIVKISDNVSVDDVEEYALFITVKISDKATFPCADI